jgi:hypothetical protein
MLPAFTYSPPATTYTHTIPVSRCTCAQQAAAATPLPLPSLSLSLSLHLPPYLPLFPLSPALPPSLCRPISLSVVGAAPEHQAPPKHTDTTALTKFLYAQHFGLRRTPVPRRPSGFLGRPPARAHSPPLHQLPEKTRGAGAEGCPARGRGLSVAPPLSLGLHMLPDSPPPALGDARAIQHVPWGVRGTTGRRAARGCCRG